MKSWKYLLPVLIACLLAVTLYRLFIWPAPFTDQMRAEIPLTAQDGVRFGSSARAVAAAYGAPVETKKNPDTGRTVRSYRADILDSSAEIDCRFITINGWLVEMKIRWELDSEEDARAMLGRVSDIITEWYRDDPHFIRSAASEEPDGGTSVRMELEYGATGIYYFIKLSGSALSVDCLNFY